MISAAQAVLNKLVAINSFAAATRWCEEHPVEVSEGYVLSKEAVIVWVMKAAGELIKRGIRINCTLPGTTETPMMSHFQITTDAAVLQSAIAPIGRRSTPMEQAAPVVFLNSDAASYINAAVLPVDGGFMAGVASGQIESGIVRSGTRK